MKGRSLEHPRLFQKAFAWVVCVIKPNDFDWQFRVNSGDGFSRSLKGALYFNTAPPHHVNHSALGHRRHPP
jgi:hypothetical protein